jgi:hypothetical protein
MSSATKLKTPQPQNINGARGASTLSKKRFVEFEARVKSVLGECEEAEEIMKAICDVMKFDPSVPTYCEGIRERLVENNRKWRRRKKDERSKAAAATAAANAADAGTNLA